MSSSYTNFLTTLAGISFFRFSIFSALLDHVHRRYSACAKLWLFHKISYPLTNIHIAGTFNSSNTFIRMAPTQYYGRLCRLDTDQVVFTQVTMSLEYRLSP